MYGFLLQWALSAVEIKAAEKPAEAAPARRGAGKSKSKASARGDGHWDWTPQIQMSKEIMCKVMKLKLGRIFLTTSDRDTFINLFTRSVYLMLESEQRVKSIAIRMHAFKVLCIAVKHHGHAFGKLLDVANSGNKLLKKKNCHFRSPDIDRTELDVLRTLIRADGRVPPYPCRTIRLSTTLGRDSKVLSRRKMTWL